MTWIQRHQLRHYVRNALWIPPVCSIPVALVVVRCLHAIEQHGEWEVGFSPGATQALFGTLAGSLFTFIVFLCSSLLVVMQLAGAQLSPRILGIVFRDPVTRFALTMFTFNFTFVLAVLLRIRETVPALTAISAAVLSLLSLGLFLYLIDHVGRTLRPSGALQVVSRYGHVVIREVYPRRFGEGGGASRASAVVPRGEPGRTVASPRDGVVLAFDQSGLVALARGADCVIELVAQVGDFIAAGSPLFRIHGGSGGPPDRALCDSVALGFERTMEQDPAFAFRIIVDVASKGLSPAINDPTTAVLAIDQIHHLLRSVGSRDLDEGLALDSAGALRLVYPTPDWEDFVYLAVTEIRHFGGTSIQVARRLRAMLENLMEVLPAERRALLRNELALLQRSAGRCFPEPEDQALAEISDLQGVGGNHIGGRTHLGAETRVLPNDALVCAGDPASGIASVPRTQAARHRLGSS
jgi:uncharacterized membrane protein